MSDYNWSCTHCEAQTKDGFLVLRDSEISKVLSPVETPSETAEFVSWDDLEKMAENTAKWEVQCPACAVSITDDGYVFTLDRIDTHAKALEWTLHLSGREFSGPRTNWSALLRSSSVERITA